MMPSEGATVIGRSMKIDGEITGSGDLLVDGELEGTVRLLSSRLTVRAEGRVKASILAQDVIVLGTVEGEVRATGRVELRNGSTVLGNVFSQRLSIEEGAILRGSVDPTKAETASASKAEAAKASHE
jgi:cytoskeletal protein CcmA (bactofilin family)